MRTMLTLAALALGCGSSTTIPDDDPPTDAGGESDGGGESDAGSSSSLSQGVIYDDCGPADGPAIGGFVIGGDAPMCDGSRTSSATPRLEIYAAGSGPSWSVGEDFVTFRYCPEEGACEDATSGTLSLDPPMGDRTTVQVDLVFPSISIEDGFIVQLCADDVLCG